MHRKLHSGLLGISGFHKEGTITVSDFPRQCGLFQQQQQQRRQQQQQQQQQQQKSNM